MNGEIRQSLPNAYTLHSQMMSCIWCAYAVFCDCTVPIIVANQGQGLVSGFALVGVANLAWYTLGHPIHMAVLMRTA